MLNTEFDLWLGESDAAEYFDELYSIFQEKNLLQDSEGAKIVNVSNENDKETIDTTVRHPFYVVGYGFRFASELRVGDKVLSVSGDIYEVTSVEIEDLDEPVKIYNFEVEDWHTYFVSESGILVHNTTGGQPCGAVDLNENDDTTTSETSYERYENAIEL